MTFSIVARDRSTGALGVAVATSALAVGRAAPWARAGVGAVVTQAHTSRAYGARGLDLLATGMGPSQVLDQLTAADPERDYRQVAILDPAGPAAVWTGRGCLSACGHVTGEDFSAQGNTLRSRSVLPSMVEAFQAAEGRLAERLVAALRGAEDAGGDIRGRQSAALLVVSGRRTDTPWDEVIVDLRVDDATDPVGELARLVRLQRAYESGDLAALRERAAAGVPELFAALDAARHGDREAARAALAALRRRPGWEGVVRRMTTRHPGPGHPGPDSIGRHRHQVATTAGPVDTSGRPTPDRGPAEQADPTDPAGATPPTEPTAHPGPVGPSTGPHRARHRPAE